MEAPKYTAMRNSWYRTPPEVVAASRQDPETPTARRVEAEEGAAFDAFAGAFAHTKQRTEG